MTEVLEKSGNFMRGKKWEPLLYTIHWAFTQVLYGDCIHAYLNQPPMKFLRSAEVLYTDEFKL